MHGSPSPRGAAARRGRSPRTSAPSPAPSAPPPDFSSKAAATFTSCLTIAVEGAIPIERPDPSGPTPQDAPAPAAGDSKRAPRKSKTDALAALHTHAQSTLGEESLNDTINDEAGIRIQLRDGPPISVPPRLTYRPRPFGLADCPTFHPTQEQWKDPMSYIASISETGKRFGMCKIVPPSGWTMPFVTDTERFRFKTRLQRLNSIEASSRAKVNFLEQLYRFHKQQGNPRVSVPTINHKPLDLWLLRKEVHKLGGYEAVTREKKWADLGRLLGYTGIPGLATQIRNSYSRVILPYEQFCDRVRSSPALSPNKPRDPQLKTHVNIQSAGSSGRLSTPGSAMDDESPPSSPLTATSSPLSEPPDEGESKDANGVKSESSRPRRSARHVSQEHGARARRASNANEPGVLGFAKVASQPDSKTPSDLHCEICLKKDQGEKMLICDGCDCGFHMFCLDPPLVNIPRGQWFCHTCLFGTGGDFGFDEGEEHSLSSFQARDLEFRRLWFLSHPPQSGTGGGGESSSSTLPNDPYANRFGNMVITEDDVEKEFWRLVQSQNETVEVEYGADVHSTTHGSGMPSLETHPLDPYSKDPWNLNNIPILPQSLLRYIKSDISGMTVPWTYVGMIFSTFCWHNEDHYTYSVNYMHWGETKTWYSIPGTDAEKFEAAIRKEAPDLFEAQPDLLFQLVTLMNPQRLAEAGVNVYACNQRAGEFVVTFPKAYHAGFNHGLNFNEAVNFALPDWLPLGLDCVKRYQEHRKLPVFSHDELLITITQQSQSIQTALLNDSLQEMTDREMEARTRARALQMNEVLEETDRADDQYQCAVCKVFCYLSQITCQCTATKVVCIDHVEQLCKCPPANHVLRKRFSDTELQDIQAKVSERAAVPTVWRSKLKKLLDDSPRPPLKGLRALFSEGERIQFPLTELNSLRKCVGKANEWLDSANTILVRKPTRKRTRKSRGRSSTVDPNLSTGIGEEIIDKPERSLDDLYALLAEVENLGFDAPEIAQLRTIASEAEETRRKARALLDTKTPRDRDVHVQECERLILRAQTLNVLVDEIVEVEKIVLREQLVKELEEALDDDNLTLDDVRQLMARAHACNLPVENPYMQRLETLLRAGTNWEEKAKVLLDKPQRTLEDLEEFVKPRRSGMPVDPDLLERILDLRRKGKDCETKAKRWLAADSSFPKPSVNQVVELVTEHDADFDIPAVQDLKRTVDFAQDLEARCDAVMRGIYNPQEEPDIFHTMLQWRKYAKDHLTMFSLTNFETLDGQLAAHFRWLEGLPWYCRQHQEAHGQPILDDVVESTRPEDDLPPNDEYFTCICTTPVRPPAHGTMSDAVQCDHCFARFHGICAANGGSCPFCDHHHWNGTIHKERSWHFFYLPTLLSQAPEVTKNYSEDWKQLEIIVHRVDRLCGVIGQFLSFASQPTNQRVDYIPQVRHYMRKLYKIQFSVSPSPDSNFGLELAGLHRILAGQPIPVRMKKRRRPKFVFGQDIDKDWLDGTRCICRGRTNYLLNFPKVECEVCNKFYHGGCVFFPVDSNNNRFMCPLCCVKKNRVYPYSEVRVKHIDTKEADVFVDTKEMLDTFSKDIIYMRLPPPYTQTLFVELIRFTPGQPDNVATNGSASAPPRNGANTTGVPPPIPLPNGSSAHPRSMHPQPHPHPSHSHHPHGPVAPPSVSAGPYGPVPSGGFPPPPPWAATSRWSSAAAAAAPPGARPMPPMPPGGEQLRSPLATPPQASRKRKYPEDIPLGPPDERLAPAPLIRSPKRHHSTQSTPQPSAARPNPGMSPSLAMMLAQVPGDPRSPTRQPSGSTPYSRGPPGLIPSSPIGRAPGPEDGMPSPSGSHHRKVKLGFPGGGPPNSRGEEERWGPPPPPPHDGRSPPGPPRH
ncbi:PLU-1-like protein-domain-containing protein [Trametes maxima]|nr:PLU-1-like protein-domain-containing protein [Trametes maxima]